MKTKRLISTFPLTFIDRTVYQRKVVLQFDEFIIYGIEGFGVKTTSYTERPLAEGDLDYGLLTRLEFDKTKVSFYTNEQIQGLFQMVNKSIDIQVDSFPEKIREMMSEALLIAVVSENTFGLNNMEDWEFVTDEMLSPPAPVNPQPEINPEDEE